VSVRALAVAVLGVALAIVALSERDGVSTAAVGANLTAPTAIPSTPPKHSVSVTVSIDKTRSALTVPPSYFGISTEYWSLPNYERRLRLFSRVLSLLQVTGGGPLVLRIGGDSADRAFWNWSRGELLPRAFSLQSRSFAPTALLVQRLGLRLILDLNLMAARPAMAAAWARAAVRALPPGSLAGFEIGNEPDLYHLGNWYRLVTLEQRGLPRGSRSRATRQTTI
jgi:hypothetical protein